MRIRAEAMCTPRVRSGRLESACSLVSMKSASIEFRESTASYKKAVAAAGDLIVSEQRVFVIVD